MVVSIHVFPIPFRPSLRGVGLAFGRFQVQTLVPLILIGVFQGSPQSQQRNAGIVPRKTLGRYLSPSFPWAVCAGRRHPPLLETGLGQSASKSPEKKIFKKKCQMYPETLCTRGPSSSLHVANTSCWQRIFPTGNNPIKQCQDCEALVRVTRQ